MILTVAVVLTWLAATYRLWVLLTQPRTVWRTAMSMSILAAAIGLTLYRVRRLLDERSGVPNLGSLAVHVVFAIGLAFLLIYLAGLRREIVAKSTIRMHIGVATGVAIVMVLSWTMAPVHDRSIEDWQILASHRAVVVYCVTFWLYLVWALGNMSVVSLTLSRRSRTEDPTRRISLGILGLGAAAAIPALVLWATSIVIRHVTGEPATAMKAVGDGILPWPMLLNAIGCLSLFVLPYMSVLIMTWRQLLQLKPLWEQMIAHYPQVHLRLRVAGGPLTRLQLQRERAIIEIHDALRIAEVGVGRKKPDQTPMTMLAEGLRQPTEGGTRAADLLARVDSREADVAQILGLAQAFRDATR